MGNEQTVRALNLVGKIHDNGMESRVVNAEYTERILNLLANGKWVGSSLAHLISSKIC